MRMNYPLASRGDKARRRRRLIKFASITLILISVYFGGQYFLGWLYNPFAQISKPLWQVGRVFLDGTENALTYLSGPSRLAAENKRLEAENERLRLLLISKQGLEKENKELREIFGFSTSEQKPILGRVIFNTGATPYDILTLDVGRGEAEKKIKTGDWVVAGGNILLGRIAETQSGLHKVKLLSSDKVETPVSIGEDNLPAQALGKGSGNFQITLPKGAEVRVGDKIVAPAYHNYLIGVVGAIRKNETDPFQVILFKAPVNLFDLRWVEIYGA